MVNNEKSALLAPCGRVGLRKRAIHPLPTIIFTFALFLSVAGTAIAQTGGASNAGLRPSSALLLITHEATRDPDGLRAELDRLPYPVVRSWPEFGITAVRVDAPAAVDLDGHLQRATRTLSKLDGVEQVGADLAVHAAHTAGLENTGGRTILPAPIFQSDDGEEEAPNDPLAGEQWSLTKMGVLSGWQVSRGNDTVAIALIDSGYDLAHEDLAAGSLWTNSAEAGGQPLVDDDENGLIDDVHGWDWIDQDNVMNDPYGHGSHVGGIIGATTNNRAGVAGLGGNLRIMPLRILDETGSGQLSDLLDALAYARSQDVKIVNLSLVLRSDSMALAQALEVLAGEGMLLIAATGNQNDGVLWPAAYPHTLAVAATDRTDMRAEFSNFGPEVDLAAPGVEIMAPFRDGSYAFLDGTSMAAPHVATLAGLIWSLRPDLGAADIRSILLSTAADVNDAFLPGKDEELGAGRIDFAGALQAAGADIVIEPVLPEDLVLAAGSPGMLALRVTTPVTETSHVQPIAGAIVRYQIFAADADDAAPPLAGGAVETDATGAADILFHAPEEPGAYRLALRIGLASREIPLEVAARVYSLALELDATSLPAGEQAYPLTLRVFDALGQPAAEPVTVELATTRGAFGNGEENTSLRVENGVAVLDFLPGIAAGDATVSARAGLFEARIDVTVAPGAPALITLGPLPPRVVVLDMPVVLPLECSVVDRFGNPVEDGTTVEWRSADGELDSRLTATISGQALNALTVPSGSISPILLRLATPDGSAEFEARLEVVANHQWLPIVRRE
jgi:subtilisin family serine protease